MQHEQPQVVSNDPCHTQIWHGLDQLESAIGKLRMLHEKLIGADCPPDSNKVEMETSPSFATVIGESAARLTGARVKLQSLYDDFESLCLQARKP